MRRVILMLATAGLVTTTTAHAAEDGGLRLHSYRGAGAQSAIGAQLGMTLKLDSRRAVRDSERLQIGIAAGPIMAVQDARTGAVRHGQSQLAGFTLHPGYSASLMLAGRPIATGYTTLGAAEDTKADAGKPKKTRKGPSTIGWIAISLGAVASATVIAYGIAIAGYDGGE